MMQTFSTRVSNNAVNVWLLIARIGVGAAMLTHGIPKLQHVIAGNMQFGDPIGIGQAPSLLLAVFAEALCSFLLIIGFATRFASIALIINMLVIVFLAMGSEAFGKKELAVLYLLFYIGFSILGAGKYSVDHLMIRKSRSRY